MRDADFEILDKDRSSGSYFVHYVRPLEKEAGWLDWLFDDDEADPVEALSEHDYLLEVNEQSAELVTITIQRVDGLALSLSHQQSILALIKGKIS